MRYKVLDAGSAWREKFLWHARAAARGALPQLRHGECGSGAERLRIVHGLIYIGPWR